MKWILLLVLILTHSPLSADEQYTKADCDRLNQQKEQIRKRLNAGYGFAEGERLDKEDRELFQLIAAHCTSPVADTALSDDSDYEPGDELSDEQITSPNQRPATTKYANVSLQQMPAWSGHNAIFKGDKVAAWTEFYQVPRHCRQKELSEAEFVQCADHKTQQRQLFEQKWQRLKFSPVNIGAAQAVPSSTSSLQAERQPVLESIPAYTMEPTNSPSSNSTATQPSGSRYVENIQQQFHWVGIAVIIFLAVLSWLIWRQ
jgi:hypothetical protein